MIVYRARKKSRKLTEKGRPEKTKALPGERKRFNPDDYHPFSFPNRETLPFPAMPSIR
jgi:hypothetical protein